MSDRDYYKKLRKKVKDVMTKARYEHTLGVEFTAASLAMRYGVDIDKAEIAGLLHDCAKCIDDEDKFDDCKKYKIELTDVEKRNPFLIHSKLGAVYANKLYGIDDEEVISAIRFHTTGKPDMTLLEKIIFIADYIEPGRDKAPNLKEIRQMAFIDIDEAMYMILKDTLDYLDKGEGEKDELTKDTFLFYKEIHDKKENN
ncbi:MAG: bis(5'-nucleosyl)-tetraphosphatase (symmetrical) YqeK [Lachnospiraceae bacterium]|jgi:predicted HD superfamily hydrolase involved in NAD metabolism|nr:bis(5'-nucleosyl)-tetraphosphatase (symmetrical) YqeK [Lachnospiraceae bacterium]